MFDLNKLQCEQVYDRLCCVLTDYEGNGEEGLEHDAEALYRAVVDVVNAMAEAEENVPLRL